jgi:hypothetical protein
MVFTVFRLFILSVYILMCFDFPVVYLVFSHFGHSLQFLYIADIFLVRNMHELFATESIKQLMVSNYLLLSFKN